MRLIDADALLLPDDKSDKVLVIGPNSGKTLQLAYDLLKLKVNNAPTIDAVPVVRCRECVHYKICDEWENGKRMLCEIHHHSYLGHDGDENFCSWGQRKEADHENVQ